MTVPEIAVIVVAYHGADDLHACLSTLGQDHRVVVVDNSSDPDVRAAAERNGAVYCDAGANLGFAGGVNAGLAVVPADSDVLLLNPDARVEPATVRRLHDELLADEERAAVSPQLVDDRGTVQPVLWPLPTPFGMWREALGLPRRHPERCFAVGACLLLKRSALDALGGFDERFFLYAEETDWQHRAIDAGWTIHLVTQVSAWHRGAGTSDDATRREALFHAGTETYIRKWHGAAGWASYRMAAAVGAAIRSALLSGDSRDLAKQRLRLYLRGPRRAAGLA